MDELENRYHEFCAEAQATFPAIYPNVVSLIAVSKTKPASMIRRLARMGHTQFAENYVQEALGKILELQELDLSWHFIGAVQRNKTRDLAKHFDWVQTVDRLIIAERLSAQRPEHKPPLNVLIQVNIDDEPQKNGCLPTDVAKLSADIAQLPRLKLRGLMCIPEKDSSAGFGRLKALFDSVAPYHDESFDTLSMGMSSDWKEAVQSGSTMIRIGSTLFGARG